MPLSILLIAKGKGSLSVMISFQSGTKDPKFVKIARMPRS